MGRSEPAASSCATRQAPHPTSAALGPTRACAKSVPNKSWKPRADSCGAVVPSWSHIARRIRVPVGFVFAVCYFWLARPTPRPILIGAIIVLCGLFIRALASGYVQKNEELTTGGPYAYTRNPLYFGSLILAVGFGWAAQNWWIAAAILLIFVVI